MTVYDVITQRIMTLMQQGVVPWRKPWSGDAMSPRNMISKRQYRGVNVFLLAAMSYRSPYWLTYKQARQLGGFVRKGEKSCPVVFWKWIERKDKKTDQVIEEFPVLRYYSVFNLEQCELPGDAVPLPPDLDEKPFQPIDRCEQVVRHMPQPPAIEHDGGDWAYYHSINDTIHLPKPEQFDKHQEYYATLFHELTHATGHVKRLARKGVMDRNHPGLEEHSKEELIAEMGAAFLCGHCAIEAATIENSASYIAGWLSALANDHRLVIHAATNAQKAADSILGRQTVELQDTGTSSTMSVATTA